MPLVAFDSPQFLAKFALVGIGEMTLEWVGRVEIVIIVKELVRGYLIALFIRFFHKIDRVVNHLFWFLFLSPIFLGFACFSWVFQLSPFRLWGSTFRQATHEGQIRSSSLCFVLFILTSGVSSLSVRCNGLIVNLVLRFLVKFPIQSQ